MLQFQFTHPGKGATRLDGISLVKDLVSIHAPWEGCDEELCTLLAQEGVSIHAPWEGCDFSPAMVAVTPASFNSRTREGCDSIAYYRYFVS